jgi:hypothetical protein
MPLKIILVLLAVLAVSPGALAALTPESQAVQFKDVASGQAVGGQLQLPQRDRSGRAEEGEQPATVGLAIAGDSLDFNVRAPRAGLETAATATLRIALIFWNKGEPPLAPPSVLIFTSGADAKTAVGGRVFASAASGGPRLLRSSSVWPALGARATTGSGAGEARVLVSVPLSTLNELCPNGLLLDVRLLGGERLYSLGSAASWGEPPGANRAAGIELPPLNAKTASQGRVAALAAAAGKLSVPPGPQLWVWSRTVQPLEEDECAECSAPGLTVAGTRIGEAMAAIESSLKVLEDGSRSGAAVVSALRNLGRALLQAGIRLSDGADPGQELKGRIVAAIRDQNSRAAYGADLLLLLDMVPAARGLLEEVLANDAAAASAKAHALSRLEQLSAAEGDWAAALGFAERLPAVAPFDINLRAASVQRLTLSGADAELQPELENRVQALRAAFAADRQAICLRYFSADAGSGGSGSCPLVPAEER